MECARLSRYGLLSVKGRLLATFLVIPAPQGFLLQLARDLAPAITKRLSMFVLRSKVKIADESDAWVQFGVWNTNDHVARVSWQEDRVTIPMGENRVLRLEPSASASAEC